MWLVPIAPISQADGGELRALASTLNVLNDRIRPAVDAAYNGTGNIGDACFWLDEFLKLVPREPQQLKAAATLKMLWSEVDPRRANESHALFERAQHAAADGAAAFLRQVRRGKMAGSSEDRGLWQASCPVEATVWSPEQLAAGMSSKTRNDDFPRHVEVSAALPTAAAGVASDAGLTSGGSGFIEGRSFIATIRENITLFGRDAVSRICTQPARLSLLRIPRRVFSHSLLERGTASNLFASAQRCLSDCSPRPAAVRPRPSSTWIHADLPAVPCPPGRCWGGCRAARSSFLARAIGRCCP
jgi:hypothetical protein